MATTLTTQELADEVGVHPRTLRKFLRADARERGTADSLPGKGSRYAIDRKQVPGLKKRFTKWQAAEAEARAQRAQKAAEEAASQVEPDEDPLPTPEEVNESEDISVDS